VSRGLMCFNISAAIDPIGEHLGPSRGSFGHAVYSLGVVYVEPQQASDELQVGSWWPSNRYVKCNLTRPHTDGKPIKETGMRSPSACLLDGWAVDSGGWKVTLSGHLGCRAFSWRGVTYRFYMPAYLEMDNKVYEDRGGGCCSFNQRFRVGVASKKAASQKAASMNAAF
jgi:hypothetical protein